MSPRQPAECDRVVISLRTPGRRGLLVALTGQDARALRGYVHALELYVVADEAGANNALIAMRALVAAAQPKVWPLFREAIAAVLDAGDVDRLWQQIVDRLERAS